MPLEHGAQLTILYLLDDALKDDETLLGVSTVVFQTEKTDEMVKVNLAPGFRICNLLGSYVALEKAGNFVQSSFLIEVGENDSMFTKML